MRRLRMCIEFDGVGFSGWQRQAAGERTIQGAIEEAFGRLPGRHSALRGAGRTDAGVHALAMVAHIDTTSRVPDEKLRLAVNAHLPGDVVIWRLATTEPTFESQYDCRYRRYIYRMRIARGDVRGLALDRRRVLHLFREMDVAAMQRAASAFEGRHDFSSFATQETRTRERTVHLSSLRVEGSELRLHIAADGFLRNMVRTVVGTLLWVGQGKVDAEEIPELIAARDRGRAGPNVAPHGLYFAEAGFEPWDLHTSETRIAELRL